MVYLALVLFVIASFVLGWYASRSTKGDLEGYFIGGRSLGKWAVGISAGATGNSGFIVVAAVGMGYTKGFSAVLFPAAWMVGDILFWYFFAERINDLGRKQRSITIPHLLGGGKEKRAVQLLSGVLVFFFLLVYASAQFTASGKVISSFLSISVVWSMFFTFLFVVGYCFLGGFNASVWTDLLQGLMMLVLTIGLLGWGFYEVGGIGAFGAGLGKLGASYTSWTGGAEPWQQAIFLAGIAFLGFGFNMSQPQMTTRILAARSVEETRAARWICIGFLHFTWMGMCVIGMLARQLLPGLGDGERALPAMASHFFHPLLVGAVMTGMMATILSSLDSILIAAASTLTVDFSRTGEERAGRYQRYSLVIAGALALGMSLWFEATVYQAAIFAITILGASVGSAMVWVSLGRARSSGAMVVAILVGGAVALIWRLMGFHERLNDGLVGFGTALLASYLWMRLRDGE